MILNWVLGIITALFGGLNIFQFIFWRAERTRHQAVAEAAAAEAKQKSIDLQQDQFDFLQDKLSDWEKKYDDVVQKLHDSIDEKTELKKQISELKGTVEAQNRKITELQQEIETFSKRFIPSKPKKTVKPSTKKPEGK